MARFLYHSAGYRVQDVGDGIQALGVLECARSPSLDERELIRWYPLPSLQHNGGNEVLDELTLSPVRGLLDQAVKLFQLLLSLLLDLGFSASTFELQAILPLVRRAPFSAEPRLPGYLP